MKKHHVDIQMQLGTSVVTTRSFKVIEVIEPFPTLRASKSRTNRLTMLTPGW